MLYFSNTDYIFFFSFRIKISFTFSKKLMPPPPHPPSSLSLRRIYAIFPYVTESELLQNSICHNRCASRIISRIRIISMSLKRINHSIMKKASKQWPCLLLGTFNTAILRKYFWLFVVGKFYHQELNLHLPK